MFYSVSYIINQKRESIEDILMKSYRFYLGTKNEKLISADFAAANFDKIAFVDIPDDADLHLVKFIDPSNDCLVYAISQLEENADGMIRYVEIPNV